MVYYGYTEDDDDNDKMMVGCLGRLQNRNFIMKSKVANVKNTWNMNNVKENWITQRRESAMC